MVGYKKASEKGVVDIFVDFINLPCHLYWKKQTDLIKKLIAKLIKNENTHQAQPWVT